MLGKDEAMRSLIDNVISFQMHLSIVPRYYCTTQHVSYKKRNRQLTCGVEGMANRKSTVMITYFILCNYILRKLYTT